MLTPSLFSPLLAFVIIAFLAGAAALFLVEAMASVDGNEQFKASIEFSTLAELFFGRKWHWVFQIALYIALQSQTIASLIESFQVSFVTFGTRSLTASQSMDAFLVTVAHKSCAISFQKGWECGTSPTHPPPLFFSVVLIYPHQSKRSRPPAKGCLRITSSSVLAIS
jgi:hypothetical protein